MMGGTTTHGLPYPLGSDRVADGDDSIKALAEAVDTGLWPAAEQAVTMSPGYGPFGGSYPAPHANALFGGGWVKLGGMFTRAGSTLSVAANTPYSFCTLYAGIRPAAGRDQIFTVATGVTTTEQTARIVVASSGVCQIVFPVAATWTQNGPGSWVSLDQIFYRK